MLLTAMIVAGASASSAAANTDSAACTAMGTASVSGTTFSFTALGLDCVTTDSGDAAETDHPTFVLSSSASDSLGPICLSNVSGSAQIIQVNGDANSQKEYGGELLNYALSFIGVGGTLTITGGTPSSVSDNAGGTVTGSGSLVIVPLNPSCAELAIGGTLNFSSPDTTTES